VAAALAERWYQTRYFSRRVELAETLSVDEAKQLLEADEQRIMARDESRSGNLDTARGAAERAIQLYRLLGDTDQIRRVQMRLRAPPLAPFEPEARSRDFAEMIREVQAGDDVALLARLVQFRSYLERAAGRPDTVAALAKQTIAMGERLQDSDAIWWGWYELRISHHHRLRLDDAAAAAQQCLAVSEAIPDTAKILYSLDGLTAVLYDQGLLDSVNVYEHRALELAEHMGDQGAIAQSCYSLCLTLWYQDRYDESLPYCERALEISEATGDWSIEVQANQIIANILSAYSRDQEAIDRYHRVLAVAAENRDFVWQNYACQSMHVTYWNMGLIDSARVYLGRAEAILDSIPTDALADWDVRGSTLVSASFLAELDGDLETATKKARAALEWAEREETLHGDLGIIEAGNQLAYLLLSQGKYGDADSLFSRVRETAEARGSYRSRWPAEWGLAEVAWRTGERSRAISDLDLLIEDLEAYRAAISSPRSREGWFGGTVGVYDTMIQHRLELSQADRALEYFERMKARALLDVLISRGLEEEQISDVDRAREQELARRIEDINRRMSVEGGDLEGDLRAARAAYAEFEEGLFRRYPGLRERSGRGRPIAPPDARRMLAPNETALLYVMGSEEVTLLAVTNLCVRGFILEHSSKDVRAVVRKFVESVQDVRHPVDLVAAGSLYEMLLAPADSLISKSDRLCIVPSGELYAVPFHALVNPETNAYLVEEYAVYVTPSLSTLGALRLKGSRGRRDLLAFGDPDFGHTEETQKWSLVSLRGSLSPLTFSRDEVASIAEVYAPRARVLTGREASESAFKKMAGQFGTIHLASHGLIDDGNPLYSSIAFAQHDEEEDGYLEAREVMRMELGADIVILSACSTAPGSITSGEGITGLSRSFFIAGVPTVVASLWSVDDRSTSLLMTEFHRQLRDGERPANAMAAAQRKLLQEKDLGDPFYWAAFTVYGDSE
jgi:CHAT domain-containing protein/tetratricopeptide (TPR) repeat protein